MSATVLSGVVQSVPGLWGFALAAIGLIASSVSIIWVSSHRRSVQLARVGKDLFKDQGEHEEKMLELANAHNARMYELETDRQQKLLLAQLQLSSLVEDRGSTVEFPFRKVEPASISAPAKKAAVGR